MQTGRCPKLSRPWPSRIVCRRYPAVAHFDRYLAPRSSANLVTGPADSQLPSWSQSAATTVRSPSAPSDWYSQRHTLGQVRCSPQPWSGTGGDPYFLAVTSFAPSRSLPLRRCRSAQPAFSSCLPSLRWPTHPSKPAPRQQSWRSRVKTSSMTGFASAS